MSDTTYVDYVAPAVSAEWLNEINDHVWHDTPVQGTTAHDAAVISFVPSGTGAVSRTMQDKARESVSVKDFGAVGDGVTDDTLAIQKAVTACPTGIWIDGLGLTYKVTAEITASGATFKLRNINFVTTENYASQGHFTITSPTVMLEDISVDGGRGTYKTGYETWSVFTSLFGYSSIAPTLPDFFRATNMTANAVYNVNNVNFFNLHAQSGIQITTYGTVNITNSVYRNCSNKTFHVYHSPDNGVTQAGRTIANNLYAQDIGILPATYLVDGVLHVFADAYAPQGSFNFIVSHGDFVISNAFVWNYGSCGVTADRNRFFSSDNVVILNTTNLALSNNSSGAMWLEACENATINNLTIMVSQRDARELAWDSSLLQLYCVSGSKTTINNLICISDPTTVRVTQIIRGSVFSNAAIYIDNFYVYGRSVAEPLSINSLPDNVAQHDIRLSHGYIRHGGIRVECPEYCTIDDVRLIGDTDAGNIAFPVSGNPGVTGPTFEISVTDSHVEGSITCDLNVLKSFKIMDNKYILGPVSCAASDGTSIAAGNSYIGNSLSLSGSNATTGNVNVLNNSEIVGITTISFAKNARVSNNSTRRRIEIKDVQTFEVVGNTAKTDVPEPVIWIHPLTISNVLAGVISSNNVLIKIGTVGAGFVFIDGGITGVINANNNNVVIPWS